MHLYMHTHRHNYLYIHTCIHTYAHRPKIHTYMHIYKLGIFVTKWEPVRTFKHSARKIIFGHGISHFPKKLYDLIFFVFSLNILVYLGASTQVTYSVKNMH